MLKARVKVPPIVGEKIIGTVVDAAVLLTEQFSTAEGESVRIFFELGLR